MGFNGTILAAKATSGVDVDRVLRAFDFGPPEAGNDGWFLSESHRQFDKGADYFEGLVSALDGPAFVVKVFEDDWAYLIAAAPGSEPIVVVLTPEALRAQLRDAAESDPGASDRRISTGARLGRFVPWIRSLRMWRGSAPKSR